MWGQNWGQMVWGNLAAVPALGFWGVLLLGAALGIVAMRSLKGAPPRGVGLTVLAIALLVPIVARALPFTFTNGTVADANQVNTDLAALVPLTGFSQVNGTTPIGAQSDIFAPSFVAQRAMTCVVNLEAYVTTDSGPTGNVLGRALKLENGVTSFASAPPSNGSVGVYLTSTTLNGLTPTWASQQTRSFTVASGATVQFGVRLESNGTFASARTPLAVIVYHCH